MSAHTPGPYSIHPCSTPEEQFCAAGEHHRAFHYAYLGIGAGDKLIAEVRMRRDVDGRNGYPSPDNLAEMQANAALFIAAPDLADALEALMREFFPSPHPDDYPEWVDARAALTKAGRTPCSETVG